MLAHMNRKSNEVMYCKCINPNCSHCTENPVISTKAYNHLVERNFKWPNPIESTDFPGHFKTYLEMEQIDSSHFKTGEFTFFLTEHS